MKILRFEELFKLTEPCIFSFGSFDGVHKGHSYLFKIQKRVALARNMPCVVFTFLNPPKALYPLVSLEDKRLLLQRAGTDIVIECAFTEEFRKIEAKSFLEELEKKFLVDTWVVGSDVRFGRGRKGDRCYLEKYICERDRQAFFVERWLCKGQEVSSTRIRQAIAAGDYFLAKQLLGHSYGIEKPVV